MVKAVQPETETTESPNTQGKPKRQTTTDKLKIINPDSQVEFKIDFEGDDEPQEAVSDKALGGTELMKKWLFEEMEKKEPGLFDKFQFISTRVRKLEKKQRILWVHDLANDPEVQHLKEKDNWGKYERVVFVSHWQQYQFQAYLGLPYDQGIVIQNAIHPIPTHEKPKEDDKINVCYFSTPHRGLEVLLDAWDFLRNTLGGGKNAELNIYSSFALYDRKHMDEQFRHIYKRARNLDGVNYHGTITNDEIREMLKTQHIMSYPSIYEETSCLTLIEAMSAGCLGVVPNLGAIPETGANFPWMYGWEPDPKRHAQVHGHILGRAIEHFWDEDVQNLLKIQQNYFDMFYNWSLRGGQWQQFLHAIEQDIPVDEVEEEEGGVADGDGIEEEKEDGTTS